jgi:hypothetical protein
LPNEEIAGFDAAIEIRAADQMAPPDFSGYG